MEIGGQNLFGVQNGEAVLAILARHATVSAVFQGHAHRLDVQALALGGRPCTFVVLPALIQFPLAWVRLDLSPAAVCMRLQPLPLPELRDLSRVSGSGQEWRAGRPEWWNYTIPLT